MEFEYASNDYNRKGGVKEYRYSDEQISVLGSSEANSIGRPYRYSEHELAQAAQLFALLTGFPEGATPRVKNEARKAIKELKTFGYDFDKLRVYMAKTHYVATANMAGIDNALLKASGSEKRAIKKDLKNYIADASYNYRLMTHAKFALDDFVGPYDDVWELVGKIEQTKEEIRELSAVRNKELFVGLKIKPLMTRLERYKSKLAKMASKLDLDALQSAAKSKAEAEVWERRSLLAERGENFTQASQQAYYESMLQKYLCVSEACKRVYAGQEI